MGKMAFKYSEFIKTKGVKNGRHIELFGGDLGGGLW